MNKRSIPRRAPPALLLVLVTCGKVTSPDSQPPDRQPDSSSGGAGLASTGGSASAGRTSTSGAGGAETGGSTDGVAGGVLVDEPSRQTVTFHVTNASSGPRYVATLGVGCTVFSIERTDPSAVVQIALANTCGPCGDCPNPPPGTKQVAELAAGASINVAWDARSVTLVRESTSCGGSGAWIYDRPVLRPVPAGAYRAEFAVFATKPASCNDLGQCDPPVTTLRSALPYAALCTADSPATGDFVLPAEGDIVVPVELP